MKIIDVRPYPHEKSLLITFDNGTVGELAVSQWLKYEAFADLSDNKKFEQVHNGGYFIEWSCGADLSIDTVIAHIKIKK